MNLNTSAISQAKPKNDKPFVDAEIFAHAYWIWPENHQWDIRNGYALFRKSIVLPSPPPPHAPLFITADQSYRLFINGQFVARGPARGFQSSWPYDKIDVSSWLRSGRNVIAVRAYNPGFGTFQYVSQGFAGLLVAAHWQCDSKDVVINSDTSWKTSRQPGIARDTVTSSIQLFPQEHIDLRIALTSADNPDYIDWTASDFNDANWDSPAALRWNHPPWFALEPRGIPQLAERPEHPTALLGTHIGQCAPLYRNTYDTIALRRMEDRSHRHQITPQNSDEKHRRPALIDIPKGRTHEDSHFHSYLFDFGRTVVGNLVLTVRGAQGGEIIDTHLGETIDPVTLTIDQHDPTWCRMAFGDRLICRAGDFTHRFFHHYGFRYLDLTLRDVTTDGLHIEPSLDWIGYPFEIKGQFESSDPMLNRIWQACAWTQQCCSLDAYVDTPWREQAQWWGDARVQAWNTFALSNDARLLRRGITQIARQTTPDGLTYGHAPTIAHGCILPDFTLIWLLTFWDYFWQTGSTEPLRTHRDAIRRALDYFRAHINSRTGLLQHDPRFWLFLDWTDLPKEGQPAVYSLWFLIALEKLATLHHHANLPDEAVMLEAWAANLRDSLCLLANDEGFLCDGFDSVGRPFTTTSLHAQTLALAAKLDDSPKCGLNREAILDKITGALEPGTWEHLPAQPSAYWITYLFSLLTEHGHGAKVIPFIRKYWSPMAKHGTTWELFTPRPGEDSHSHAWSAHPLFHFTRIIGGISQIAPAWSEIIWRPTFHGNHADVTVPTPHGLIQASWRRSGNDRTDGIVAKLILPVGITAHVSLPGIKQCTVTGTYTASIPNTNAHLTSLTATTA